MRVIGINGSFVRKPASGMGQVSWHFIKTLLEAEKIDSDINKIISNQKSIIYLEEKIDSELTGHKLPSNVEFKVVKGWYKRDDLIRKILWEKFWLPIQVKKDKCEKLISLYQSATILPKKIKHVMLVHDVVPKIFPEYLNNLRKKIYYKLVDKAIKQVSQVATISEFSKQAIFEIYSIDIKNIFVVYDACDPIFKYKLSDNEKISRLKKYGIKQSDKFIFNVGGFDTRKNVGRLIEAYGKLASEISDIPILVLGGSFHKNLVPLVVDIEERIQEVTSNYNLDKDFFRMTGFIKQKDLPAFYQSAKLFVYPSLYEGFGIPVLEAMISECPIVTSNTTSIPEVISSEAGYLINDPRDIDETKEKIKKALTDSQEAQDKKVAKAFEESKKFSWKEFTNKILNI